jgi:NAD(P)-dependent dehydrogenase (short-subunit alcohol dehydrogenase family)
MDLQRLYSVTGKSVLITGGVGGIGRMLSEGYATAGARVFITSRKADALEETLAALRARGAEADGCVADLATHEGVTTVIEWTDIQDRRAGRVDQQACGPDVGAPFGQFPSKAWEP